MHDKLMTYEELGAALGRSPEGARQLAKRKRWRRVVSNEDGKARVVVPVESIETERLAEPRPTGRSSDQPHADQPPGQTPAGHPVAIEVLTGHIKRLEAELSALREERDTAKSAEQALALQLAGLNAVLDAERAVLTVERERAAEDRRQAEERISVERARIEEWKAVADRFATQAEKLAAAAEMRRSWWPWRRSA